MYGASVTITTQDLQFEMQRMPADIRERVRAEPQMLQQLVDNIYIRRALAAQAEHNGALQNPLTAYKLVVARETALVEAELQRIMDAVIPNPDALDKQMRSIYKAEPERFTTPNGIQTFDEVKDKLREETLGKIQQSARAKAVEKLRAQAQGDSTALEAFITKNKAP